MATQVVAASPTDPRNDVVKRVLAVEGQTVRVDHGGAPAAAGRGALPDGARITVPGGHVWLQGEGARRAAC